MKLFIPYFLMVFLGLSCQKGGNIADIGKSKEQKPATNNDPSTVVIEDSNEDEDNTDGNSSGTVIDNLPKDEPLPAATEYEVRARAPTDFIASFTVYDRNNKEVIPDCGRIYVQGTHKVCGSAELDLVDLKYEYQADACLQVSVVKDYTGIGSKIIMFDVTCLD